MSIYVENSTRFGLVRNGFIWKPDFQATRDESYKWTGSETFTCHLKDVTKLLPLKGAPCELEGFTFLTVDSVRVQNIEGDLAEVTCVYGGYNDNENNYNFDDEDFYVYNLQISLDEEPITTLYKFHDDTNTGAITKSEWTIIRNYLDGTFQPIFDDSDAESRYNFRFSTDTNTPPTTVASVTSTLGKKLVDYLTVGPEKYKVPRQIWRVTYNSKSKPKAALLNKVGKIADPPGAPEIANNRNWLFMGLNMEESKGIFTITEEYQLSDLGGFDPFIYTS
jgi:hypothetical protein